jgi:hypothetical protein
MAFMTVINGYHGKYWHYETTDGKTACGRRLYVFERWLTETLHRDTPDAPFCEVCKRKELVK